MASEKDKLPSKAGSQDVSDFLEKLARTPAVRSADGRGRLMFAMDATASREPSWDQACHIQGEMFQSTDALGGLEVQLVFFRGFGECKSSPWVSSSEALVRRMTAVRCLGGRTQIGKVLKHAMKETEKRKVNALVYVGDCMEENVDELCDIAGQLGVLGVPMFVFQEGNEPAAMQAFRQFARLTNGAYCHFDASSAGQLKELLAAVAVYAAGGLRALEDYGRNAGSAVARITSQVK
ncbi:MAG: VWA domain-containing protein [Rhodospirillaceae bacterium]|jgi:hypothetical protein|nr:VWA domain-containing protein [Rhodospirillaceae bacterium]MBT5457286.1 VWA domain-containing protein [Rhodospirillaceae bacterium]